MSHSTRARLKKRLQQKDILIAPGAYDALTAVLCEKANFEAVYLTGAGVSYSTLGKPDVGLITMTEMVNKAALICDAVNIPVIADGDTGYGNPLNVMRIVREYEKIGVAAIQLEDQTFPKRCGHLQNKTLVPVQEMLAKLQAATDARHNDDFLIIARTDARAVKGIEEAIERAQRYAEAGADIIFVEAPESVEEMKLITRSIPGKLLMANMVEGGKTPLLTAQELQEIGYRLVIFPNSVTRIIVKAASDFYHELRHSGSTAQLDGSMVKFDELNRLLGIEIIQALEEKYREDRYLSTGR